jgi:transcriptional regulator with XRE-family HTH domain
MRTQFAADLRLARRKAGYMQSDIATMLSAHQSMVSDLESGTVHPNLEQIITLSLIYGRSFESYFEAIMNDCSKQLKRRLERLPKTIRQTAHTYNRAGSLRQLHQRLAQSTTDGSA